LAGGERGRSLPTTLAEVNAMLHALLLALVVMFGVGAARAESVSATMYKTPNCGCCEEYAKYLRQHGFNVTVKPTPNLSQISRQNGVPEKLAGCHTTMIDGYVVEGHVPVSAINKLLSEHLPAGYA
jgi:hypothetical protein